MSYIELGNVMFRGELRGATGQAKFKLLAQAIDAVDTVNIAGNQVTYSTYASYTSKSTSVGAQLLNVSINVPDTNTYVEFIAYGSGASSVRIDGVGRPNRNRRGPGYKLLPFVEILPMAAGNHTVQLISGINGTSTDGYIFCRYIRRTGTDNQ